MSAITSRDVIVPGEHGRAFRPARGSCITIEDIDGKQLVDLVAFDEADRQEWLSPPHTGMALMSMQIRVGDRLTTTRRPILEVVSDTAAGVHDFSVREEH